MAEGREFMFGMCIHLGISSNNYAEYSALMYTLIVSGILELKEIRVYSDSELVIN